MMKEFIEAAITDGWLPQCGDRNTTILVRDGHELLVADRFFADGRPEQWVTGWWVGGASMGRVPVPYQPGFFDHATCSVCGVNVAPDGLRVVRFADGVCGSCPAPEMPDWCKD